MLCETLKNKLLTKLLGKTSKLKSIISKSVAYSWKY